MKNALSFDVEEYFQVANLSGVVARDSWQFHESRLRVGMDKILKLLDDNSTKATFFVLGWIAQKHKETIKDLHKRGHEVATHGYEHRLIYEMTPQEFKQDLKRSIDIIESLINDRVAGHRASNFSVTSQTLWALDIMQECGLKYDASIFPVAHHRYGIPDAERFPYKVEGRTIMEFPCSTVRLFGKNIPFSGGGYFRLLPYAFVKGCIKSLNKESRPVMAYLHPWEFDSRQPRIKTRPSYMFRHYINLDRTADKLDRLLKDFSFTTVKETLGI